ncbi:hypothetical protein ACW4TU_23120 [Streptomyces sp. QTS52]
MPPPKGHSLVFVGRDEAEALWDSGKPEEIRDLQDLRAHAAGCLAALFEDRDAVEGLRPGHRMVAATLITREDVPTAVDRVELRRLFPPDV